MSGNKGLNVRPAGLEGWTREERAARLRVVTDRHREPQPEEPQEATAPVLQLWLEGETLLEGYPVGRWYRTPTRQRGRTLYQRIHVVDANGVPVEGGRLKITEDWDPEEGDGAEYVSRAIALRRLWDGKCMTIGCIGNPRRQVQKRQDLNIAVLDFLVEDGKRPDEDRLRTRTGITDGFRAAHGGWAESDVDQAIVWSVEEGFTETDFADHHTVTAKGEAWLATEKARRAEERRITRPQGYTGDEASDARVEREERVGEDGGR